MVYPQNVSQKELSVQFGGSNDVSPGSNSTTTSEHRTFDPHYPAYNMATEARDTALTWEQSAEPCHATSSDTLPNEVVTCLQNARFLHLATCTDNVPHVSLMNYTYLPQHPFDPTRAGLPPGPTIVMTSNPSSKKTSNLVTNPNVSLLVHDWVSSRPPNNLSGGSRERSPTGGPRSSLAAMLMQMNSTAVSSISTTINGEAMILEAGSDEEKWCKEQHLLNNTFSETQSDLNNAELFGTSPGAATSAGDGGRESYIQDEQVRVVVVRIKDGRISDWKGTVKDWAITGHERPQGVNQGVSDSPMVNGVPVGHDSVHDG